MKYESVYETENAIIKIITQNQALARPMTIEENQKSIDRISIATRNMLIGMLQKGEITKKELEEAIKNNR